MKGIAAFPLKNRYILIPKAKEEMLGMQFTLAHPAKDDRCRLLTFVRFSICVPKSVSFQCPGDDVVVVPNATFTSGI